MNAPFVDFGTALLSTVGVLAALIPAWRAYRTDVSRTLAQG